MVVCWQRGSDVHLKKLNISQLVLSSFEKKTNAVKDSQRNLYHNDKTLTDTNKYVLEEKIKIK